MTIKDLENMMIVETRNQERYLVVDDKLLALNGFNHLKDYNNNLIIEDDDERDFDIMAVYTTKEWGAGLNRILYAHSLDLIWKREENLLTPEEKKYLKALIKPITRSVQYITKECNYIKIVLDDDDNMFTCDTNNMSLKFSGIKQNELYTIRELKLDD